MENQMLNLKTKSSLLAMLTTATSNKPSSEQLLKQRVSFVYGSLDPEGGVTREQVRQIIVEQEGVRT